MTLGQWYHAVKGLALGKYHTKFQLSSSPKGMKVISCKRNTDVKLHLNLQVNFNLITNTRTYGRNITAKRYICPTPAFGRRGHKNVFTSDTLYAPGEGRLLCNLAIPAFKPDRHDSRTIRNLLARSPCTKKI